MTHMAMRPSTLASPNLRAWQLAEPLWYAVYTRAQHEKRVLKVLACKNVETFLPLYQTLRRWKDRRKQLLLPLFPGYVFVRIPLQIRLDVLTAPGVVRLVGINGQPVPLADAEIISIQRAVTLGCLSEPHTYLRIGKRVRVISGPLEGMEGVIIRKKNRLRLVISVDLIMRSISFEVDEMDLRPIYEHRADGQN
jgi:transcription antitermination factor NusG